MNMRGRGRGSDEMRLAGCKEIFKDIQRVRGDMYGERYVPAVRVSLGGIPPVRRISPPLGRSGDTNRHKCAM